MHCMGCNDLFIELHDVRKHMTTKLSKFLDRRGWSATELARRARVSPSTVTRLANGDITVPTGKTVKKLAGALGVKESSILG